MPLHNGTVEKSDPKNRNALGFPSREVTLTVCEGLGDRAGFSISKFPGYLRSYNFAWCMYVHSACVSYRRQQRQRVDDKIVVCFLLTLCGVLTGVLVVFVKLGV